MESCDQKHRKFLTKIWNSNFLRSVPARELYYGSPTDKVMCCIVGTKHPQTDKQMPLVAHVLSLIHSSYNLYSNNVLHLQHLRGTK